MLWRTISQISKHFSGKEQKLDTEKNQTKHLELGNEIETNR